MENLTKATRIQMVIRQPDLLVMGRIHQMKIQWICSSRITKMKTEGKMVSRQQLRNRQGQPLSLVAKPRLTISRNESGANLTYQSCKRGLKLEKNDLKS